MTSPPTQWVKDPTLFDALVDVLDPETGISVVHLGLIYGARLDASTAVAHVIMTFTTPACPAGEIMGEGVERRLLQVKGVKEVQVEVTFEPRWTPEMVSPEGRELLGWG